ncbi:MAG: DNA polymerase I [Actinomycetota bacterium]
MGEVVLLLDGHSLAYRAFYALPETIQTSSGQPTNAVYGFLSMLVKLLTEHPTDRIGVVFDRGAPTERLSIFPEYKAQRDETPSAFRGQVELIEECLDAMGIPVFGVTEHEADDLIATLAKRLSDEGQEVICVTADRDYLQLVRPGVRVLFNRKGVSDYVLYDEAAVEDRFGVPPDKLIDLVALKGDPSDNIPSVPGIGEKTAAQLISTYGSIEGVYEHLDELPSRIRRHAATLRQHRHQVELNRQLVRLRDDLELQEGPEAVVRGPWEEEQVKRLFNALQFRALTERLADIRPTGGEAATENIRVAAPGEAELSGSVALWWPEGSSGMALASGEEDPVWYADPKEAAAALREAGASLVAHDAKALAVRAEREGLEIAFPEHDTMLAAYLLDPADGRYPLEDLALRYLRRTLPTIQATNDGQLGLDLGDDTSEADSAAAHASVIAPLAARLEEDLAAVGMTDLYRRVELPLAQVLARMETCGVAVDASLLKRRSKEVTARIHELEQGVSEIAAGPINLNSTPQLRALLYDRLGLKPSRRTKTGYSTDQATLESLRHQHPVVPMLLEHRILEKLRSTYLDALPRMVDPHTGRIHAHLNQVSVATGRIGSDNPNLQNIPIRTELGRGIREAFIAGDEDGVLVVADYSQIELRVLAHVSGDPGLKEAFERGDDIHAATASKIWGFPLEEVPRELRDRAKAINFGLIYGMNRFGLASRLGVQPDEAQLFIDGYFRSFPLVQEFMEGMVAQARTDGFTTTILGRRRYIPELQHGNPRVRALGERQALNAPIQGSAADILKLAMIAVDRGLAESGTDARMVLTVHDELVIEASSDRSEVTKQQVRSLMEQAYPLEVPLVVEAAIGKTWADAKN